MELKRTFPILLLCISQSSLAGGPKISPEDKAKISREVGESVYFECKNLGPFSTDCHVDCGNGKRFRKSSGFCFYLSQGTYVLNVNTRHRNQEIFHTAIVTVTDKSKHSAATREFLNSQEQSISINASHISPATSSKPIQTVAPSFSNSVSGFASSGNSLSTNRQNNQALQNTLSETISNQNQEQLLSGTNNAAANINNQNTLNQGNTLNNANFNQSSQSNNNFSGGNSNQNATQNSNRVSFN